jgi:Mrp family chromosome partitioning ATPase
LHDATQEKTSSATQLGRSALLTGAPNSQGTLDFQPQWEVDQLQWPSVCDRLQRASHHRLSEIVTSLMSVTHKRPRVIAITSFGRREGRTTLSLALARLACGVHARVALVDGDLEHADMAQQVSVAFEEGWESWDLQSPLGESAVLSIRDQLVLLPIGQHARAVPEPSLVERAQRMLTILRSHLDLVFVDTGPMYISAHRWFRQSPSMEFDDVCCRLVAAGVPDAAIIENFQDQG